jgi:hypothetical protein
MADDPETHWRRTRAVDRPDALATRYLGDGVYAAFDGRGAWLTAEDGVRATDGIYIEPEVMKALVVFFAEAQSGDPHA